MTGSLLLITGLVVYFIAYRIYGRYLSHIFGINTHNPTPAFRLKDDVDYIPTKFPVLFGHHFASIAGAGPIVGPILGICFGWVPVALWVIFGAVFIGAVHDFSSLFVSVRHDGRSIGHVIEQYLGFTGRQVFLLFCSAALILVVAIFAILVAKTFSSTPAVATSSLFFIVIAPVFGFLVYRKDLSLLMGSFIFVPLLFLGIYFGIRYPLDLGVLFNLSMEQTRQMWLIFLFVYVFFASVLPVWILLQPRDYLNSYLLYGMMILGLISILFVSPTFQMPAFAGLVVQEPTKGVVQWALFPILYVTVACGACSGFHALVSSGTTAKQISSEKHILPIGYGAMLVEGLLAIMALVSVAYLKQGEFTAMLSTKGAVNTFASGLAHFSFQLGLPIETGKTFIALTISAFMLTTLDTATRLTRFVIQEIFLPKETDKNSSVIVSSFFKNRYIATGVVVILAGYLAFSGDGGKIWPVFGASNQLLAALTLLIITVILIQRKKNFVITFLPFLFMMTMSFWALWNLFFMNVKEHNIMLMITTAFLILLSGGMVVLVGQKLRRIKR